MKSIAVYCGSSDRIEEVYLSAARELGGAAAEQGIKVIYGGGSTGMMGAVASAAMDAGGEVIGIIPEMFDTPQLALTSTSEYIVTPDMHTRKAKIADLAEGYIALPGGFGTLEEFFEILTWAQIGLHSKPIGLLNVNGFFDTMLNFLDEVQVKGFSYKRHSKLFSAVSESEKLLEIMNGYIPPEGLAKWVERH
jgi:uncharacterized protein (TIGR00730 family)